MYHQIFGKAERSGSRESKLLSGIKGGRKGKIVSKFEKQPFDARPIYVWTQPHIEAHFLICFISLTIMRLLEYKLDGQLSPERIQSALLSAHCRPLDKGYWEVFGSDDFLKINELLGKKWLHQFVPLEGLRK
ncbi:MAG TPA: hypothetical protein VFW58_05430 [Trichococcus sp.]|nr:hypothetical protein [Trichococcus sp.]